MNGFRDCRANIERIIKGETCLKRKPEYFFDEKGSEINQSIFIQVKKRTYACCII